MFIDHYKTIWKNCYRWLPAEVTIKLCDSQQLINLSTSVPFLNLLQTLCRIFTWNNAKYWVRYRCATSWWFLGAVGCCAPGSYQLELLLQAGWEWGGFYFAVAAWGFGVLAGEGDRSKLFWFISQNAMFPAYTLRGCQHAWGLIVWIWAHCNFCTTVPASSFSDKWRKYAKRFTWVKLTF